MEILSEEEGFQFGFKGYYYYYWSLLYGAILCSQADSLHSSCMCSEWKRSFLISTKVVYWQRYLVASCMAGATRNCCCLSKFCVHHTTMDQFTVSLHTVHVCLSVTCHLHFWQNDRDLLHATVVTEGGTDTEIRGITESWPWWWCPLWVWLTQVAVPMCVTNPGGFVHNKCD